MSLYKSIIRTIAVADKEWIQIRRDMRSLVISILLPVFLILMFGYALSLDVKNVKLAVFDQDKSTTSRKFLEKFSHTEYLTIYNYVNNYRQVDDLLDSGSIVMAMVIPEGFEKRFKSGKSADVQLLIDGSDSTSAAVASGYVRVITYSFNKEVNINELRRIGVTGIRQPVDARSRIWYNAELQSKRFIIPGVIVLVMTIVSAIITSLTMSREWERGTMETLITTPVKGIEVVVGKLIPYLIIGILDVVIAVIVGYSVFDVPLRGNFIELCLISALFLIGTSGFGILISSATRVQIISVQVAVLATYLPAFILSDYIFPIKNMPLVLKGLTYLIPAKYLMVVVKSIFMKGVGYSILWTQIIFLGVFAVITITLSIKKFVMVLPDK